MTTVPGFNLLIQQSGMVRDMNPASSTLNPEPGQAAGELVANEEAKKTIIQELEEPEKLKSKQDKDQDKQNKSKDKRKKKKKEELNEENNPDSTGRLLDTIV
ncbi:MAG: hypothetical protein KAR45_10925 [Desulfobacteraceae bacterium]|nr:hypothetical protein [Desulfobacteraceae bacterium]